VLGGPNGGIAAAEEPIGPLFITLRTLDKQA
jgi:hypothetical protein